MSRVAIGALLSTFVAFSAYAMSSEIDTDGDGKAAHAELQVTFPNLTLEMFEDMETNASGFLADEEMVRAVQTEMQQGIEADT